MSIHYQICTWQESKQQLMSVRHPVFVQEKNVPEALEIDEHDPNCTHILALDGEQAVGTARLLNDGHIGRMCVLKTHRLQGIALTMLNRLIEIARDNQCLNARLNAQLTAIPFYEKAGFETCSAIFLEAGIEHRSMQLELQQPRLGGSRLTLKLDSRSSCKKIIANLISQATQSICIFSQDLEYPLYHQAGINQAIKDLVRKNRKASIRIICKNSQKARQHGHYLIHLAQAFSSFIEIRKPATKEIMQFQQSWLLIDNVAYCLLKNVARYQGTASYNQRLVVKESLDYFNHAWENSHVDQETRRLSL